MMKRILWMLGGMVLVCLVAGGIYLVWAKVGGNSESPAAVGEADSRMYNLEQIYKYLTSHYDETWTHDDLKKKTGFTEPGAGPSGATPGTMYTLDDVAGKIVRFPATGQETSYSDYDDGDEDYQFGATLIYYYSDDETIDTQAENVCTDQNTGLMWIRDHTLLDGLGGVGGNVDISGTMDWGTAVGGCEGLEYAIYSDWRLPNVKELQSIIDYGTSEPAIDYDCFPSEQLEEDPYYWSSTTSEGDDCYAWSVDFNYGIVDETYKEDGSCYVRCVRGGQ